jgi:hypothetical protein
MSVRRWGPLGPLKVGKRVSWAGAGVLVGAAMWGCGGSEDDGGSGGAGTAGTAGASLSGAGGVNGKGGAGGGGVAGSGGVAGTAGATAGSGGSGAFATGLCVIDLRCEREIIDDEKRTCELDISDSAGAVVYAAHAGVEIRGRSSQAFPKQNYSIELRTDAGVENPVNVLGMGQQSDWVLDGCWADRSLMRNALIYDSFRDFTPTSYAARGRYCTLELNDEPQGIYRIVERIKRDDDRVNIPIDDGTGASFVIKQDEEGSLRFDLGLQDRWRLVSPNDDTATQAQREGVQSFLDDLAEAFQLSDPDAAGGIFTYLDFESTVDWILAEEFSKNIDAYNLSVHLARAPGTPAVLIPWDVDLSFGVPTISGEENGAENAQPGGWIMHRTDFIDGLSASARLRARLGPRWRELRAGEYSESRITARLDGYQAILTPSAVEQNFSIWPIEDIDYVDIYRPYSFYPVTSYSDEVAKFRAFIQARLAWIDANVDSYPD